MMKSIFTILTASVLTSAALTSSAQAATYFFSFTSANANWGEFRINPLGDLKDLVNADGRTEFSGVLVADRIGVTNDFQVSAIQNWKAEVFKTDGNPDNLVNSFLDKTSLDNDPATDGLKITWDGVNPWTVTDNIVFMAPGSNQVTTDLFFAAAAQDIEYYMVGEGISEQGGTNRLAASADLVPGAVSAVPEPSASIALCGLISLALFGHRRRA